jgi:threonine/homoserine/homoserine lactone efflux protein
MAAQAFGFVYLCFLLPGILRGQRKTPEDEQYNQSNQKQRGSFLHKCPQ